jgi:hypothetical protein
MQKDTREDFRSDKTLPHLDNVAAFLTVYFCKTRIICRREFYVCYISISMVFKHTSVLSLQTSLYDMLRNTWTRYCGILAKKGVPKSNQEKILNNKNLRENLQIKWPVLFKNVKRTKVRE